VLGILNAKGGALILAFMLCPRLLCDSPSELQKAQDLRTNADHVHRQPENTWAKPQAEAEAEAGVLVEAGVTHADTDRSLVL
jgi:hypothetical protein